MHSLRSNDFVERMNRTLLDECFRVGGRTTWYERLNDIQADLDRFLADYSLERSHQGYRLRGKTLPRPSAKPSGATSSRASTTYSQRRTPPTKPEAAWPNYPEDGCWASAQLVQPV